MAKSQVILITGASSGIGRGIAIAYAAENTVLLLTGRDRARLDDVAAACRTKGAIVETTDIAVTDRDKLTAQLLAWDDVYSIDVVIPNAGISGGDDIYAVMDTNLTGTINTVEPLIPRMIARKSGQIAIMSSMAGFRGLPNAPAYSTSKVAVRGYGDALRPRLKPHGIAVSIIYPGFVRTPLTDKNKFSMPFLMEVDKAASIIKRKLDKKRATIAFPWQMHMLCMILSIIPRCISDWILSKAPRKE